MTDFKKFLKEKISLTPNGSRIKKKVIVCRDLSTP